MGISQISQQGAAQEDTAPAVRPLALWRAVLLGLILVPVNVFWTIVVEIRWFTLDGTSLPLFVTPVFLLFVLVLLNLAWRKAAPRAKPLRQEELLLVYIMLVTSCTFAGHDTLQNMFGSIPYAYWHASPQNTWQALFFRFLPRWLLVTDMDALRAFNRGNVSIYSPQGREYLLAWIVPLASWGVFFLTLIGMYLCLTILVRRAWIENEKLTFPIVQLPLAMTADDAGTAFFQNPRMWAGFGLAFGISFLNGLHELIPTVPQLNVKLFQLHDLVTDRPWSAIGSTNSSFYPFAVGIAYFMPLDLSFSCWFFYVLARLFRVVGDVYGWDTGQANQGFPYFGEQATGAWFGLGVMLIYAGRGYWREVFSSAWEGATLVRPGRRRGGTDSPLRGLLLGTAAISGVSAALIGMRPWVALAMFFGIVFLLGFFYYPSPRGDRFAPHEIVWVNPIQVLVTVCLGLARSERRI